MLACYLGAKVNRDESGGLVSADERLTQVVLGLLSHRLSPLIIQLHAVPEETHTHTRPHYRDIHRSLLFLPLCASALLFWVQSSVMCHEFSDHISGLWSHQVFSWSLTKPFNGNVRIHTNSLCFQPVNIVCDLFKMAQCVQKRHGDRSQVHPHYFCNVVATAV